MISSMGRIGQLVPPFLRLWASQGLEHKLNLVKRTQEEKAPVVHRSMRDGLAII